MINSKQYWENQFNTIEKSNSRGAQTDFFANLAITNIPKWISEDIEDYKMTICDAGCAEGEGTLALHKQFPNSLICGVDFSENAIARAISKYPECEFKVQDIKSLHQSYDVIFSSNVLEHFYNSDKLLKEIVIHATKYCILLLPFREYYTVPEHFSYFDFSSFPLELEGYYLCYFKPITIIGEDQKYWFGEQVLIIYGKSDHLSKMNLTLKNLYNGYIEERTQIIQKYDLQLSDNQAAQSILLEENNILKKENDNLNIKIKDYILKNQDLDKKFSNLVNENKKYEKDFREITEHYSHCQQDLDRLSMNYSALKNDYASKEKALNLLEQEYSTKHYYINEAYKYICLTQSSRIYRYSLLIKRFIMQCFRKKEKKDFIKWICSKIIRKPIKTKILAEFDCLESSKYYLNLAQKNVLPQNHKPQNSKICLKETPSIVIFGSVPYYDVGGGQRSAQLTKTFNLLGYRVYYIYGFPCSEKNIPDMFIPAVEHMFIDDITGEWFEYIIDYNSMVIFEIPYYKFEPYLDIANKIGCCVVYEHIDNWDSSLGCMFYDEAVFRRFLVKSDILTITARMLGRKIQEHTMKEYIYLPNAVNSEVFEPYKNYDRPKDLVQGKNKTLIYFGSLWGDWFEWDKINYIAKECPDCEINLIGDYSGCMEHVKKHKPNVHFLGLKKQTDLPAYLKYSDIALLPFRNCEIGKYVSPLKIFEYISMNIPVLASNLDDIQGYPNVFCSDSKEVWVETLKKDIAIEDSSRFISENNWFARCERLIAEMSTETYKFPLISVIVLNYNNLKVIKRCVETLIAHNIRYAYEIIVVDNGSSDGSYEMLKQNYLDSITLLRNTHNGCSSGRNLGASNAKGEYLCFLDSDQWVISDYWLDSSFRILSRFPNIGAVAWNAGWFTPGKTTGPIVDYLPNRGLESADMWYRTDIAYLATSGLLMESSLFDAIGGFDVAYDPTCFEDTDLSLKIRNNGRELAYTPYMGIMHLPHQTTQSGSKQHTKLMRKNGEYFMNKWEKINPKLLEYYM